MTFQNIFSSMADFRAVVSVLPCGPTNKGKKNLCGCAEKANRQWAFVAFWLSSYVNIKTAAAFANWLAPKRDALFSLIYLLISLGHSAYITFHMIMSFRKPCSLNFIRLLRVVITPSVTQGVIMTRSNRMKFRLQAMPHAIPRTHSSFYPHRLSTEFTLNHQLHAGANNRNVIITHQFLVAPVRANRDFSDILTVYFNCRYFPLYTRELLETASCTRTNDTIRKKLIKKNSKILHIWTRCSLQWCNYFFAALQIIFILACVSIESHKLCPGPVLGASGPLTKKMRKT